MPLTPVAGFGFLRIGTNRRVFATPLTVATASAVLRAWLATPALENNAEVVSNDTDLLRSKGVRWSNPLGKG